MAGTVAESLTTARPRVRFEIAGDADDTDIRRLLRQSAMPGRIAFTMEQEPSHFAAARAEGGESQTLICRDKDGDLLGVGACCVRPMMVRGRETPVAYLSQLRLAPAAAGRREVIMGGYRAMGELCGDLPCFTSIMADNTRARRLLESGVRGLPRYTLLTEFDTFVLGSVRAAAAPGIRVLPVDQSMLDRVLGVFQQHATRFDLSPCWTISTLRHAMARGGLRLHLAVRANQDVGCVGVWDQRAYRQIVVRNYSAGVSLVRPIVNVGARLFGWPQLPRRGEAAPVQYLSHMSTVGDDPAPLVTLIGAAVRDAAKHKCTLITGCATNHPHLGLLKRHAWICMHSRIYNVGWGLSATATALPTDGIVHLEAAQL